MVRSGGRGRGRRSGRSQEPRGRSKRGRTLYSEEIDAEMSARSVHCFLAAKALRRCQGIHARPPSGDRRRREEASAQIGPDRACARSAHLQRARRREVPEEAGGGRGAAAGAPELAFRNFVIPGIHSRALGSERNGPRRVRARSQRWGRMVALQGAAGSDAKLRGWGVECVRTVRGGRGCASNASPATHQRRSPRSPAQQVTQPPITLPRGLLHAAAECA